MKKLFFLLIGIFLFIVSCTQDNSVETNKESYLSKTEVGWKVVITYPLHHYQAISEFGIWPTNYRQWPYTETGNNLDQNRLTKLNELKTKWGFTHIAANIGYFNNINAINNNFPINTNYMAIVRSDQSGIDGVNNLWNGMGSNYFWAYYTDEPITDQYPNNLSAAFNSVSTLYNLVLTTKPNSKFGFGETNYLYAKSFIQTFTDFPGHSRVYNPSPINPEFIMDTRYCEDIYCTNPDQRPAWNDFRDNLNGKFKRTWISANEDSGEYSLLLGYCKNNNIAPWFYQQLDGTDLSDTQISQYCAAAYTAGYLIRYCIETTKYYKCSLNHIHLDPYDYNNDCVWVLDRTMTGSIVIR